MNTNSRLMTNAVTALALTGLVWSAGAMAQENKSITGMNRPADDAASCKAMTWNKEFLTSYPWAADACHAVVDVNGEKWARFEGKFVRSNSDGSFDTDFVSRMNGKLGTVTLMPEPGQMAHIGDEDVRFANLDRDQVLSFYVPEGAAGFAIEPEANAPMVKVVSTSSKPVNANMDDSDTDTPVLLAQNDTRNNNTSDRLPNTAGPLPFLALGGFISLLGGLGLTLRRRSSKHNS